MRQPKQTKVTNTVSVSRTKPSWASSNTQVSSYLFHTVQLGYGCCSPLLQKGEINVAHVASHFAFKQIAKQLLKHDWMCGPVCVWWSWFGSTSNIIEALGAIQQSSSACLDSISKSHMLLGSRTELCVLACVPMCVHMFCHLTSKHPDGRASVDMFPSIIRKCLKTVPVINIHRLGLRDKSHLTS